MLAATSSDRDTGQAGLSERIVDDPLRDGLTAACRALWLATLSLMTAFMQQTAPAHRYLLARRIARNLGTLAAQPVYAQTDRQRFERLAARWTRTADRLAPQGLRQRGGPGLMQQLRAIFS